MDKPVNNKAWFMVLPVFAIVAFSAVLPLMTVVNYSVQDTFGNNQFFWNGLGWFQELLDPASELGGRFLDAFGRNLFFSATILAIEVPLGIAVALAMPRSGWRVAATLVILALPLLVPWNVVGTIWQVFARPDIGLLGWGINSLGITPWDKLVAAFTVANFAIMFTTVAVMMLTGFVSARWLNMYPVELAIVNACRCARGGSGTVTILETGKRMELMPFGQVAVRIGGALTVTAAIIALARFH